MPRALVTASGRAAVLPSGRAATLECAECCPPGGPPCPFWRRAAACSSLCPLQEVYVCSDAVCAGGQPLDPGAVFQALNACWRVLEGAYVVCVPGASEPPVFVPPPGSPPGAGCLPASAVVLDPGQIGPCVPSCSSCPPCQGFLWLKMCSCSATGGGSLPPTAISLAELSLAYQMFRCPAWSLGGVCAEPDYNRPWFSTPSPGVTIVTAGGASEGGCCACCGGGFPAGDPCRLPCAYQKVRPYVHRIPCVGEDIREEGELLSLCCGPSRHVVYANTGSFIRDEGGGQQRRARWSLHARFPGTWRAELTDATYLNGVFQFHNRTPISQGGESELLPCCDLPGIPGGHPANFILYFPTPGVGSPAATTERRTLLTFLRESVSCTPDTQARETTSAQLFPGPEFCAEGCADNSPVPGGPGDMPARSAGGSGSGGCCGERADAPEQEGVG